jgi:hypothetical protein
MGTKFTTIWMDFDLDDSLICLPFVSFVSFVSFVPFVSLVVFVCTGA